MAREAAVTWAEREGRLIAPPFGDAGLKVDTSREIVELLGMTPVGDRVGTVVVGPLDLDRVKSVNAVEALLKTLEDLPHHIVRAAVWAEDIGAVLGTIQSRTVEEWCPASPDAQPEAPYLQTATSLCEASLRRRTAAVIELLKEHAGSEGDLLRASAVVLSTKDEWKLEARLTLWESLREVLSTRKPSPQAVLAAYLV